jgi:hypothetical protein
MHGVAPHMCDQAGRPLLDRGAGGRSPGYLLLVKSSGDSTPEVLRPSPHIPLALMIEQKFHGRRGGLLPRTPIVARGNGARIAVFFP